MVESTTGKRRESEDIHGYKGSFMKLLIDEDDDRELFSEKTEDSGFVFFPKNRFFPVSSSSPTVQMLCFGGKEDNDNGGLLSIDQNCKPRTRRIPLPVIEKRKKAKLEASFVPRDVKIGKEKMGSHVRALQQLVSPMGKSDTASVLQEALGYIRFLHYQIQVLSSACMEEETKLAMGPDLGGEEGHLRKRGLCLVPVFKP